MTKTCHRCKKTKDATMFNKNIGRKDGLQSNCRNCQHIRFGAYYRDNESIRKDTIERKQESVTRGRAHVGVYLQSHPCVDCGCSDIRVLEFDHLDKEKKIDGVMRLVNNGLSIASIDKEIAKCEVRCRNCHVIKTYERKGGSWHDEFLLHGIMVVQRSLKA